MRELPPRRCPGFSAGATTPRGVTLSLDWSCVSTGQVTTVNRTSLTCWPSMWGRTCGSSIRSIGREQGSPRLGRVVLTSRSTVKHGSRHLPEARRAGSGELLRVVVHDLPAGLASAHDVGDAEALV